MAADGAFFFPINTASDTSAITLSDMLRTFCVAIPHISSAFTSSVVLLGVTWRAKSFYHGTNMASAHHRLGLCLKTCRFGLDRGLGPQSAGIEQY
jgi:hypothetical protein